MFTLESDLAEADSDLECPLTLLTSNFKVR